jgi:transcriptional regulator with XRE-family HTH domain
MSTQPAHGVPQWTMGDRLRKAREEAGLSQVELAIQIGVARNTIGNHELGVGARGPQRVVLNAWAAATGVPVEWLETGRAPSDPGSGGQPSSGRRLSDTELMQYRSPVRSALRLAA